MIKPGATELEVARRLLELEGAGGDSTQWAAAAGRIYEKLYAGLAPLVGSAAVRALLARSLVLIKAEFPSLGGFNVQDPNTTVTALRAGLQGQPLEIVTRATASLFGTFIALLSTYIGERLTMQALRSAWADLGETPGKETKR